MAKERNVQAVMDRPLGTSVSTALFPRPRVGYLRGLASCIIHASSGGAARGRCARTWRLMAQAHIDGPATIGAW